MLNRSLIVVAALVLGVVGCDDPEVQEKVADLLQYGGVSAELQCHVYNDAHIVSNSPSRVSFAARKMADGSCWSQVCLSPSSTDISGFGYNNIYCSTAVSGRGETAAETCQVLAQFDANTASSLTYPYRQGLDGLYAEVSAGDLVISIRDNYHNTPGSNCLIGHCADPQVWFSHDITSSGCSGRNLEAFGAL